MKGKSEDFEVRHAPDTICPNCQREIPENQEFCPLCGSERANILIARYSNKAKLLHRRPHRFSLWIIAITMVVIPLAACGGCLMKFNLYESNKAMDPAFCVQGASVIIGIVTISIYELIGRRREK